MKALLIKAWHDPVGSKVISTLIVAALGAVVLWAKSGFSSSLAVIWASSVAVWSWLAGPMTLPVGVLLLTLITFAALCWWLMERHRQAVGQVVERLRVGELDRARAEAELAAYKKAAITQLVKGAKASLELTDKDKLALRFIYGKYPGSMEIRMVSGLVFLQYPAAEKLCEKLEALGFVKCIPAGHNPASVFLTKQGRDYCIENGLEP